MTAGMVIVGAGECGARGAFALREHGYGGPVTLIGEETHLPYERPPLSKDALTGDATVLKPIVTAESLFEKAVVLLSATPVVSIDRVAKAVRLGDGARLSYDKLLLATGSAPRKLSLPGLGGRCVALRTFDDAVAIRSHLRPGFRVAVVGGGFIGLELAASARSLGAAVTVIEAQGRILMRGVPAEIAALVEKAHRGRGVEILCGDGIASVEDDGKGVCITLASGCVVTADLAVIGIGTVPATGLADQAGLALDNGVAVDGELRTSDPDIYAAGDCCSFPLGIYDGRRVRLESWRNAQEQGALAARNMLGAGEKHDFVPWFWSDQYDWTMQIAGLADEGATDVRRNLGGDAFILFHLAGDGRLVAASGVGPGNAVARDIRLAELLIAKRARPDPRALATPSVKLKSLLAA